MRLRHALIAAVLCSSPASAGEPFSDFLDGLPLATTTLGADDNMIVTQGGEPRRLHPKSYFALPFSPPVTISGNTAALPSPPSGTLVQGGAANAANALVLLETFGVSGTSNIPFFDGRVARGTASAPLAVQSDDVLAAFGGRGHDGIAYSAGRGSMRVKAAQNWSPSAHGTYLQFLTTGLDTIVHAEKMRLMPTGELLVGTTSVISPGGPSLQVKGPVYLQGTTSGGVRLVAPAVAGSNVVTVPADTGTIVLQDTRGHVQVSGATAPVLTSCGTSPAIIGDDQAGEVTMGTGTPTGCVITFNTAYVAAPLCVVTWQATPLAAQSYALVAASITLTQTATSSNKVNYNCRARNGG